MPSTLPQSGPLTFLSHLCTRTLCAGRAAAADIRPTSVDQQRFCPCERGGHGGGGPPWFCKKPAECNVCGACCEPYIEDGPDCDLCVQLKCGSNFTCSAALEKYCGAERDSLPACERCAGRNMPNLTAANVRRISPAGTFFAFCSIWVRFLW